MCFYDAELLRLRAHTHADPDARQAAALDLARSRGATLFELRAARFAARGLHPPHVGPEGNSARS